MTRCWFIAKITSPLRNPVRAAGLRDSTSATSTPCTRPASGDQPDLFQRRAYQLGMNCLAINSNWGVFAKLGVQGQRFAVPQNVQPHCFVHFYETNSVT